jgi:AcrR family transcriptional regulator
MAKIKGQPLREAVLRAAIPTFVDKGYENASMDEIAARAGTTKRTVYAHFGAKEQLFRAAIARAVELSHEILPPLGEGAGLDPAVELEAFAIRYCALCIWERAVRLQRVAMGEADRFPDLGQHLHRDVIERTEQIVAGYLSVVAAERHPAAMPLAAGWALERASMFLNMATGAQRFAALLQVVEPIDGPPDNSVPPEVDPMRIGRAVRLFLAGLEAELAAGAG